MRQIKFRAWCKDSKSMEYFRPTSHFYINLNGDLFFDVEMIGDRVTLMQYTGIRDAKGKEIYEGDIVRYIDNRYDTGFGGNKLFIQPVEWNNDGACFFPMLYYCSDIMVVGNIYETPELLRSEGKQ